MLKVFDKNLIPLGVLTMADEVQRKRRINSDYELSFLVPMSSEDYMEKIRLKGHVRDERDQYYVINERKRVREGLKRTAMITCSHIMFKLQDFKMPYTSYIGEAFGVDINTLTNSISAATGGKFTFVIDSGVFDLKDIKDFGRGNCLQALNFVIKEYGAEIDPNNFVIHLKKQIGVDAGLQYRFKKNIVNETFNDSTRALVTRMYAQMKDGLTFIGLPSSVLTPEEYVLLNAVPGAIVGGIIKVNFLISPYSAVWANNANTYFDGEFIDQNIEDQTELLKAAREALKKQEVPTIDVSIDAADLYKIDNTEPKPSLGDTVYMIDKDMELDHMTARIVDLTEYPHAMDKHAQVTLANYLRRDLGDIISDLDRAKQIVNDIVSGGTVRTTVFEAFAKQAIYDINNSKTEVKYDQRGIILQDKDNPSNLVVQSAKGIYISIDGGVTPRAAITANGVVAEVIVGLLGQFVQLRANQIVVGDSGEKIADNLLASAANWNGKTTLITSKGIYTGTIQANQIDANTLSAISANLGTITAGSITGATIQTASLGQRVVMDLLGLRSYDNNSKQRVSMSTSGQYGVAGIDFNDENGNYRGSMFSNTGTGLRILSFGDMAFSAAGGTLYLRDFINFGGAIISGLPISSVNGLQETISSLQVSIGDITARLQYLENKAFTLSYKQGSLLVFNSKNVPGVDSVAL